MSKHNYNAYRQKVSARLRNLGACLSRFGICSDVAPLNKAAGGCKNNKPTGNNSWGYEIVNQIFRIPHDCQQTYPEGVQNLTLTLTCAVEGKCLPLDSLDDSITLLEVSLDIMGDKDGSLFYTGYHFDKHVLGEEGEEPDLVHPLYHFHHGGHFLRKNLNDSGNVTLLGSPRIAHPPLEGVLIIDFILSNFLGDKWIQLCQEGDYLNPVTEAQRTYWEPYFRSLASKWHPLSEGDVAPETFWPQLV